MTEVDSKYQNVSSIDWEVGAHTQFCGSIFEVIKKSIDLGMTVTQFFFGNPKAYKRHRATQTDIEKTIKLCERFPTHIFSHFPYIANLNGSKASLAWNGDIIQDSKTSTVLKELEYELSILSKFSTRRSGVVIHPGNYPDRKKGIFTIAKSINMINFSENSKLLLENSAGQGTSLATTFEEIKEIYDQVDENKQKHIGVCVDTAHIFGYGLYDLSKCSEVEKMFLDFDRIIGIENFTLLHLNDSEVPLGSKKDRHACIGTGFIWSESIDSFILLLKLCKKYGIPSVLETNTSDMLTLSQISNYLK